jgi:hypothetical protein
MTGPNFGVRAWLAFDPPTSTSPTWVEITSFVEQENPIPINHGRGDGLSDVNASTCSLTVDNSDGRFSSANPAGAWYGQIHKGNWLKVEIVPPSGTTSSRFVGFVTSLPTQWSGQYVYGQITASDRFEKLGQNAPIVSMIQSEVLSDPNLAGNVQGYWNLHEAQGTLSFGDTSGKGSQYLRAVGLGGVPAGIGMGASNVAGPGFDGLRAVTFNPLTTTQGTYLTAPISPPPQGTYASPAGTYTGLAPTIEFWFQATTTGANQMLACFYDATARFAYSLYIDGATGLITHCGMNTNLRTAWIVHFPTNVDIRRVDDGRWHHVIWSVAAEHRNGDNLELSQHIVYLDGILAQGVHGGIYLGIDGPNNPGLSGGNFTQLFIGGGYDPNDPGALILGAANICEVAYSWADTSYANAAIPNCIDHYAAGTTGFLGESAGTRIARVARYAGIPIPTHSIAAPMVGASTYGMTITTYNPGTGPWTNLAAGAHLVGTQSMAGRKPLDVMQEAAHTEAMPLYEDRSGYLTLQPSTVRQNTSPAWSVNALELDPSTQVADDFAYTTNQMTVTPNGQAAQTVIGGAGSAGQLSQAKFGIYDGSQATASVNPIEAQSLGLGLIQLRADPAPRLAPLALEVSTTALLPGYGNAWYDAVLATEISTPIRVTNAPPALGGTFVDVLVEGWTETITAGNHTFAFNVSPAQGPTYQLDDVVLGHIDTDGSTLAGSTLNTVALTFQVATTGAGTGSPLWTRAGADFPFDINIGGEQITISGIAGTTSPQTFTASARSVNGVVASHSVGSAVSLWQPLTLAY